MKRIFVGLVEPMRGGAGFDIRPEQHATVLNIDRDVQASAYHTVYDAAWALHMPGMEDFEQRWIVVFSDKPLADSELLAAFEERLQVATRVLVVAGRPGVGGTNSPAIYPSLRAAMETTDRTINVLAPGGVATPQLLAFLESFAA